MNINIYLHELGRAKKSLLFWSLGIVFLISSSMGKYQGYAVSGVPINDLFKTLPPGFNAMFGIGKVDLTIASGFFVLVTFYLAIMLGVQAVLIGAGIIAKEETDKTAEFLFSKPVSRSQAFTAKVLAAFTALVLLNIVTAISSILIVGAFNKGESATNDILLLMPGIFFIQVMFLAIGTAFAAIMRHPKRAGQFSGVVLLATYVTSAVVDMTDKFDFLRYLTPFKYFDSKTVFVEGGYNNLYIIITVVFVVSLLIVSRVVFNKRDFSI